MADRNQARAPLSWTDPEGWMRLVAGIVNGILDGKIDSHGTVTLTANAGTTTLNDRRIGGNSVILLGPQTANAAAAVATTYVSATAQYSATITHANNAQTDKTFGYVVIG